jgi:hypothetical protein
VQVPVDELLELLKRCTCFASGPTCWDMACHARRVYEADLSYPILVSAEGNLIDGSHRIAKAWILGHPTASVARFLTTPQPDTFTRAGTVDERDEGEPE